MHAPKSVECPGCPRNFSSSSAMILHLEEGTCESQVDHEWVTETALKCYASRFYTSNDPDYDFMCPDCETPFRYISGMLQHIESNSCDEDITEGQPLWKFLRFLQSLF